MAHQFGRLTNEPGVRNAADVNDVVSDQTVAARDKLQRRLRLADAGITGNKQACAVNIDQYAVTGLTGRQLLRQIVDELYLALGGLLMGRVDRYLTRRRQHQQLIEAWQVAADYNAGQVVAEKLCQPFYYAGRV